MVVIEVQDYTDILFYYLIFLYDMKNMKMNCNEVRKPRSSKLQDATCNFSTGSTSSFLIIPSQQSVGVHGLMRDGDLSWFL